VRDADVSQLQEWLQHMGMPKIGRDQVHQAVDQRAMERAFHPVRDYLDGVRWDKTHRLDEWLSTYLGATGGAYEAKIGRMFLVGMVDFGTPRQSKIGQMDMPGSQIRSRSRPRRLRAGCAIFKHAVRFFASTPAGIRYLIFYNKICSQAAVDISLSSLAKSRAAGGMTALADSCSAYALPRGATRPH
jgi:hypothetical protein